MKILILGGHGFVGKSLVEVFKNTEHEIFALSREDGLDLTSEILTKKYFRGIVPDIVYNCAAHGGSLHYVTTYAASVVHDNMQMALNVYKGAQEMCPKAWIINPLSNCSYPGEADIHYEPDWWKGEVHHSVYAYGNTKRMIYVLAYCYKVQYGIKTINFLVPNIFGPGDYTDPNRTHALNGMIIRMIKAHREKQLEFEIWGSGEPMREWGYIADVVEILKKGLTVKKDLTYPVNIAQNRGYSIRESAEMIADVIEYEGKLVFNTKYQDGAPKKILDDQMFRELFPQFKFTDHKEGIENTVHYYQSVL